MSENAAWAVGASEIIGSLQRLDGRCVFANAPLIPPIIITISMDDDVKADLDLMCQMIQRGIDEDWLWISPGVARIESWGRR